MALMYLDKFLYPFFFCLLWCGNFPWLIFSLILSTAVNLLLACLHCYKFIVHQNPLIHNLNVLTCLPSHCLYKLHCIYIPASECNLLILSGPQNKFNSLSSAYQTIKGAESVISNELLTKCYFSVESCCLGYIFSLFFFFLI